MATSTQNILENILSPKIINDGSGGYKVKTDILNVDMIQHSTSQCGQATLSSGNAIIVDKLINANSVILLTSVTTENIIVTPSTYSVKMNAGVGFTIISSTSYDTSKVNWFIAKY